MRFLPPRTHLSIVSYDEENPLFNTHMPEDEMKRTQKNKATEGHLGHLKAKLAKLRTEVSLILWPKMWENVYANARYV